MYETFYGFTEKPFSLFPDHRFLFLNRRYKLALSLLEFGVLNKNGMILLTGDPGIGKTTLLQKILADIDETVIVGNLTFTHDKEGSVLPWVLKAFGLQALSDRPADMFQALEDFFSQTYRQERAILLVVDEAQNLGVEKLEELRLLFNLNDRDGPVFQILLAGHTQLREQLKDPQLSAFVQRIGTDFSLELLSEEDAMAYVRHRILIAGGSASLFSDKACDVVYRCTRGNPRLINQLCETSLIYGFSEQASRVTETLVAEAARDRQQSGLFSPTQQDDGADRIVDEQETRDAHLPGDDLPVQGDRLVKRETTSSVSQTQSRGEEEGPRGTSEPKPQDYRQSLPILKPKERLKPEPVTPITNPGKYWKEGFKLRDEGWCLEAIQNFKRAATHSQYHASGWFQVGQCYLVLGRKKEALKAFRTSLSNPHSSPMEQAPIQYAMGQVLEDMGEIEESKRYYQLAYSTDPKFDPGQNGVQRTTSTRGSSKSAIGQEARPSWIVRLFRRLWSRPSHNQAV